MYNISPIEHSWVVDYILKGKICPLCIANTWYWVICDIEHLPFKLSPKHIGK